MIQLPTFIKEFSNGNRALSVRTDLNTHPASIVKALQLPECSRLFMLSGGAGGMADEILGRLTTLFTLVGQVVAQQNCTVIDGGTQSGVMQLMGECLTRTGRTVPHIGVVPAQAQAGPNGLVAEDILEPNHSNFVLVKGDEWGDEIETMYSLAAYLSAQVPSVAMLVNGGRISLQEVEQNVKQGREIIVVSGSGRLADEITEAMRRPNGQTQERIRDVVENGHLILFDLANPPDRLAQIVEQRLNQFPRPLPGAG